MSEYFKHRIDYINSWPNVELFQVEKQYREKCEDLRAKGKELFLPMKMWYSEDRDYNIAISQIMDSLDMMPYYPNHAFLFLAAALDNLLDKKIRGGNTTEHLKNFADKLEDIETKNVSLQNTFKSLYNVIPMQACGFLANAIFTNEHNKRKGDTIGPSQAYKRVTQDEHGSELPDRSSIVRAIQIKYHIEDKIGKETIRNVASLFKKILNENKIELNGTQILISENFRLDLLLSGLIYSFRNAGAHGKSMAFSKSSLTDMKRYALNYFCFLSTYTVLMSLLIDTLFDGNAQEKYNELYTVVNENCEMMRSFFGHNLG